MKIGVLITIFLVLISCKNVAEKEMEKAQIVVDSTGLKIKTTVSKSENLKLKSFLENPIDLHDFKTNRSGDVTTSVTNGLKYYFHPKINDSIFYSYNLLTENIEKKGVNKAIVFKYGNNKHKYDDETEILIELRILNADVDLGNANLVGRTKTELETEFGTDYLKLKEGLAYSNKNKVLILSIENKVIKSYRYLKLNTENISNSLIHKLAE